MNSFLCLISMVQRLAVVACFVTCCFGGACQAYGQSSFYQQTDSLYQAGHVHQAMEGAFEQIVDWLTDGRNREDAKKLSDLINSWPIEHLADERPHLYRNYISAFVQQEWQDSHREPHLVYLELAQRLSNDDVEMRHLEHRVYRSLISSSLILNNLDSALLFARQSYHLGAELYGESSCKQVHDCFLLAYCLIETGKDEEALPIAQEAVQLAEVRCDKISAQFIDAYRVMGYYYVKSNYQASKGIPFYRKALFSSLERQDADRGFKSLYFICRTGILSKNHTLVNDHIHYFDSIQAFADEITKTKIKIAQLDLEYSLRVQQGDVEGALAAKLSFLNILNKKLPERITAIFDSYFSILEKYLELDKKDELRLYLKEMERYVARHPLNPDQMLSYKQIKSSVLASLGEWDEALITAGDGVKLTTGQPSLAMLKQSDFESITDLFFYRKFVGIFADYYEEEYNGNGYEKDLLLAYSYLNQVVYSTINMIERDDERISIQSNETIANDFERLIHVSIQLYELKNEQHYLTSAFQLADMASNLTFLRGKKQRSAITRNPVSDSLILHKQQLLKKIRQLSSSEEENALGIQKRAEQKLENQVDISKIDLFLEQHEPLYMSNIRAIKSPDIALFQKNELNARSAYVRYFYYKKLVAFVALQDRVFYVTLEPKDDFRQLIASYVNVCEDPTIGPKEFATVSRKIGAILLDPIISLLPEGINVLCISPYGKLANISFESMLIDSPYTDDQFSAYNYLIREFAVSYAYSMSSLLELNESKKMSNASFLGVAPTYYEQELSDTITERAIQTENEHAIRNKLMPLAGAKREINKISNLLNSAELLEGDKIDAELVVNKMRDHSIWHFAMHAFADENDPMMSRLMFPSKNISENESITAAELYQMDLQAEMVVLSACNSGKSRLDFMHGPMSLARAFAYSGGRSTVLALWPAADQATARLFPPFYKYLMQGVNKDIALRAAKLDRLNSDLTDQYLHPYYWNGFTLWGSVENQLNWEEKESISSFYKFILLSLVIGLLCFIIRLRKPSSLRYTMLIY